MTVARLDWDVVTVPQLAALQPDIVIAAGIAQLRPLGPWVLEEPLPVTRGSHRRCAVLPGNSTLPGRGTAEALCVPEGPAGS